MQFPPAFPSYRMHSSLSFAPAGTIASTRDTMRLGRLQQPQERAAILGGAPTVEWPVCSASSHSPMSQPLGIFGDTQAQATEPGE